MDCNLRDLPGDKNHLLLRMGHPRDRKRQEHDSDLYLRSVGAAKDLALDPLEKIAKMAEDLSPVKDSLRAIEFTSQLTLQ